MSALKLSASARYGYGGKQFIARITGRHPKFTFAYAFLGRKEGPRITSVDIDDAGLYVTRDVDSKGRADDSYALVWVDLDGALSHLWIAKDWAMKLAKALDAGETPDWRTEGEGALARKAAAAAKEAAEKEQAALVTLPARIQELKAALEKGSTELVSVPRELWYLVPSGGLVCEARNASASV